MHSACSYFLLNYLAHLAMAVCKWMLDDEWRISKYNHISNSVLYCVVNNTLCRQMYLMTLSHLYCPDWDNAHHRITLLQKNNERIQDIGCKWIYDGCYYVMTNITEHEVHLPENDRA